MADDLQVYSSHILEEIAFLKMHVFSLDFGSFAQDGTLWRAATYAVQIISEAARQLPTALTDLHPEVPWRQIRGIGNVTRHDYANLRLKIIWEIATVHIVPLESAVLRISGALS
jgi:uncharacterized protein with HEPN domain